ncbi:MAG: HEAT repeat domain-containing protein [Thermostichus sp. BF3_bins_97]
MSSSPVAQVPSTAVAQLAAELEQATSPEELLRVVRALGALGQVEGIPSLIRAFGFNRPAVGEAALEEVLRFGDVAVQPLLEQIDGFDYGARAYSVRALARIGHGNAYPFLVEAIVADFAPSVRRAAVRGLGRVAARRPLSDQERALELLRQCLTDAEVLAVPRLAKRLEAQNRCPQDVEWAIDADLPEGRNLLALQARPETVWSRKPKAPPAQGYATGIMSIVGTLNAARPVKR